MNKICLLSLVNMQNTYIHMNEISKEFHKNKKLYRERSTLILTIKTNGYR